MSVLRELARAAYEEWVSGVECCEPSFEELPEDHIERLERSLQAAFKRLAEHSLE